MKSKGKNGDEKEKKKIYRRKEEIYEKKIGKKKNKIDG